VALATVNDIVAGLGASAQDQPFLKIFTALKAAGAFQSGWLAAGRPAAGAAAPAYTTSGYTCSSATTGALAYVNGSVQNWLARVTAGGTQQGTLYIADRLWSCSGMGFAAATYTVTAPGSMPARTLAGGAGSEIWVENFVAAGAASGTLTVNYLDQGGAAGAGVIPAVVSAPVAGQMQPVPLAAGDTGVTGIVSAVSSATWTSGSFGLTVLRTIAAIPLPIAGVAAVMDWASCLEDIQNDACLMMYFQGATTTAPTFTGRLEFIDK
jgi:hypothetical protein